MLIEGRHFLAGADPRALGHKALAVNLSDLAAMGAAPRWATLALGLPAPDENWLAAFSAGFFALAERHGLDLIGGDTTRSPQVTIAVTALGEVPSGVAMYRASARADDDIWVSGELGSAALALTHPEIAAAAAISGCVSASAAEPSSPDTQMSSSARALARYIATPEGTSPSAVTAMVTCGLRVVSPPIRSRPWRSASAKNPAEKAASQFSSGAGRPSASVAQRGAAPIAARSERFTASALWPSARGSAPARKWRPSISMSVVTASSRPASGRSSAQSSPIPSSVFFGGRSKNRRMISNSFRRWSCFAPLHPDGPRRRSSPALR